MTSFDSPLVSRRRPLPSVAATQRSATGSSPSFDAQPRLNTTRDPSGEIATPAGARTVIASCTLIVFGSSANLVSPRSCGRLAQYHTSEPLSRQPVG